jgi:hypothetical protein
MNANTRNFEAEVAVEPERQGSFRLSSRANPVAVTTL